MDFKVSLDSKKRHPPWFRNVSFLVFLLMRKSLHERPHWGDVFPL